MRRMFPLVWMATIAAVLIFAVPATPAVAQEADTYLDDRSSAETLVRSLYNALNRKEYLRAWSYFAGTAKPAAYEAFAEGYADTGTIRVRTGEAVNEGAAGSLYTRLPVVIEATGAGGVAEVFSGCYVTLLVQPANQATPPFRPLEIVAGSLAPSDAPFSEAQGSCEGVEIE